MGISMAGYTISLPMIDVLLQISSIWFHFPYYSVFRSLYFLQWFCAYGSSGIPIFTLEMWVLLVWALWRSKQSPWSVVDAVQLSLSPALKPAALPKQQEFGVSQPDKWELFDDPWGSFGSCWVSGPTLVLFPIDEQLLETWEYLICCSICILKGGSNNRLERAESIVSILDPHFVG